jgi:hypothetical protein
MLQWRRRHWIPPAALCVGQMAHGISWILLLVLATQRPFVLGLPALGWLHLVALGWLTMTALAVLIHVIPTFTEVPWWGERMARTSLLFYGVGVTALVTAFWIRSVDALPWAGSLVALALVGYLIPAGRTLMAAFAQARLEAAIARALSIMLACLFVTALIGVGLAWALAGRGEASLLSYGPPIHASFGLIGWLTVLIMGVSTRTVRPITGAGSRHPWAHITAGALEICGLVAIAAGVALGAPLMQWIGLIGVFVGALVYVGDLADVLQRASVAHRPPQAFLAVGALWLVAGLGLSVGALAGEPWGAAALYLLLIGWIGQMMNGHLHHIGVRLIATMARGDDDETRPDELLVPALSWASFGLFQAAVAAGGLALMFSARQLLTAAALAGLVGWIAMGTNVVIATRRARQQQLPPASPTTISLLRERTVDR